MCKSDAHALLSKDFETVRFSSDGENHTNGLTQSIHLYVTVRSTLFIK